MEASNRELRLTGRPEPADVESRAVLIADRLAAHCPVVGEWPEWIVTYDDVDTGQALRRCAADLTAIDPAWAEVLQFEAVASQPIAEPEFS